MLLFTSEEKVAIMRLAMTMAGVDNDADKRETALCLLLSANLGMDESELDFAEALDFAPATYIVSRMTIEEKTFVCSFIAKLITADGKTHPAELKLWNLMSSMCDFPLSFEEALSKFSNYA